MFLLPPSPNKVTVKVPFTYERFLSTDVDVIPRYANLGGR
jgi:hypothetical protein